MEPTALRARPPRPLLATPRHCSTIKQVERTPRTRLARLVAAAKRRGKHVHMGRVNSRRRWSYAEHIGCDSVDGTFLAFGPDANLPRLTGWITQSGLDFGAAS